jgi:hypothetical protein
MIVYKVVSPISEISNEFQSAWVTFNPVLNTRYVLGKETQAKPALSRQHYGLFVFDTLDAAREWMFGFGVVSWGWKILRCRANVKWRLKELPKLQLSSVTNERLFFWILNASGIPEHIDATRNDDWRAIFAYARLIKERQPLAQWPSGSLVFSRVTPIEIVA